MVSLDRPGWPGSLGLSLRSAVITGMSLITGMSRTLGFIFVYVCVHARLGRPEADVRTCPSLLYLISCGRLLNQM